MSNVRPGALIAIIVFAVFAAYAFLAPATYRTSALLMVDSADASAPATMPEPLEAARRLAEAMLDRKTLERLSRERAGDAGPAAQAQASSDVRRGLEIDTSDGHAFSISYRDMDPARTQRACNDLAQHAVELAPQVLVDRSAERARDQQRQQQTQELAAFLALHPEVAVEATPLGNTSPDKDLVLSALNSEHANLERRISQIENGVASDNPYVDPRESDVKLLRRRLAEIDTALNTRRQAYGAKPTGQALAPEVRAEWKRLLDVVTQSSTAAEIKAPNALVARLASAAPLPSSPIEPNRRLLLFFGAVFGIGLGAAFALASRSAQMRRSNKSSRPPATAGVQGLPEVPAAAFGPQAVQVPSAPALPSGLGPPVPGPQSYRAPPIVPMMQRTVSSSPPDVAPRMNGGAAASDSPSVPLLGPGPSEQAPRNSSSRPPERRFTSTLVLPPAENPVAQLERTPDPVLASAEQAWDQQIRAHEVPGFAVVKPGSEPPPAPITQAPAARGSYSHAPAASVSPLPTGRRGARPTNQMKVTQPLGSFLPDGHWEDPARRAARSASISPLPTRSAAPAAPPQSPPPSAAPPSRYSYVSSSHPPATNSRPPAATNAVAIVRPAPDGWRPSSTLKPELRRPICEQLYPLAVERCVVIVIVGPQESHELKSRVAAELALALSESGHPRILLMEGDLQSPNVHRLLNVDMSMTGGFSQQLRARVNRNVDRRWTVIGCGPTLHVLGEGMMRTPGLLLSRQFAEGLGELRNYYDFILIDGPSTSLEIESQALDAVADGVIFVSDNDLTPSLARVQSLFGQKRIKVVVSNSRVEFNQGS